MVIVRTTPFDRLWKITTRWDLLQAFAAVALGLLLYGAGTFSNNHVLSHQWIPPLLILGFVAQLVRRTYPLLSVIVVVTALIPDVLAGPSLAMLLIFADVLYAACVFGSNYLARSVLFSSCAIALVTIVTTMIMSAKVENMIWATAQMALLVISPVTGIEVRQYRERAQSEERRAEQMARLTELDRQAAVTAERTRMARELHDVIANHLSAISVQSTAALSIPDLDRATITDVLTIIRESSVKGLAEMKDMIFLLRESADDQPPGATPRLDDVEQLLTSNSRSDKPAELTVTGERTALPAAVDLAAYRIVQESLTNATKHGGPGPVRVTIDYADEAVRIAVRSALPDIQEQPGSGLAAYGSGAGLLGMRERTDLLGGTFSAGRNGSDWLVRVQLPTTKTGYRGEFT